MILAVDSGVRCTCGARMLRRRSSQWDSFFLGCERYPACSNTISLDAEGSPIGIIADQEMRDLRSLIKSKLGQFFDLRKSTDREALTAMLCGQFGPGRGKVDNLEKEQLKRLLVRLGE